MSKTTYVEGHITYSPSMLKVGKWVLREVKRVDQGHTARRW